VLAIFQIGGWREFDGNNGLMPRRVPDATCTVPSAATISAHPEPLDAVGQRVRFADRLHPHGSVWLVGSPLPLEALCDPFRVSTEEIEDIVFSVL
jgi:hypothetical protein